MKTDFEIARSYISTASVATVFNQDFNNFSPLTSNQAWSLFFTAGRDDAALGSNPELGRFFNNILKASVFAIVVAAFTFRYI